VLNERFSEPLRVKLSRPQLAADDAAFISIDRLGTDVRVRHGTEYSVERLSFDTVRGCARACCGRAPPRGADARASGPRSTCTRWRRRWWPRTPCCRATA